MNVLTTSFLMLGTMKVNSGRPSGKVRNTELRNDEHDANTNLENAFPHWCSVSMYGKTFRTVYVIQHIGLIFGSLFYGTLCKL